jgi:hypothetical protein
MTTVLREVISPFILFFELFRKIVFERERAETKNQKPKPPSKSKKMIGR